MEKSFTRNTITRYEEIRNILTSGSTGLSSADYQFYLRYCKKHGIAHEKVSVVEKPVRGVVRDRPWYVCGMVRMERE